MLLLVGGTGDLGGRIARRLLSRGVPLRVLVRRGRDTTALRAAGAEIAEGDLRDPASLVRAVLGCQTVVSTATAIARALAGEATSIGEVDGRGMLALISEAEIAGVERFVYVSAAAVDSPATAASPLGAAKRAAEERLRRSAMREVIVRPDMFMEIWLSELTGFDWRSGNITVFGRGEAPAAYVATDDVAELVVRLALEPDPPRRVEFGGPEALTRHQAIAAFQRATGRTFRVRHVPRALLRLGSTALRRIRPHLASTMALSLSGDLETEPRRADDLHRAGIEPLAVSAYIDRVTAS